MTAVSMLPLRTGDEATIQLAQQGLAHDRGACALIVSLPPGSLGERANRTVRQQGCQAVAHGRHVC
jgi:hypothetical protein